MEFFILMLTAMLQRPDDHQSRCPKRWQKYVATGTIKGIDRCRSSSLRQSLPDRCNMVYFHCNISEIHKTDYGRQTIRPD